MKILDAKVTDKNLQGEVRMQAEILLNHQVECAS